jgi:beta-1,2-mannobiose phosphorylase / 1,2-beta-oligomannan phosphorylase
VTASWNTRLNVERMNGGKPLISADPNGWDDGFTLNPTATYIERSPRNDEIIRSMFGRNALRDPRLQDGILVVFYRGVPTQKAGLPALRSSVGLAAFTPDLKLLKRFPYPVVVPTDDPMGCDFYGVEDQRITKIGDTFYMVYCGFNPRLSETHNIRICMAESKDLVHWTKLGPIKGNINDIPNKDAVMLPGPIDGKYMMLHRPCVGCQGSLSISLAVSDSPTGVWQDLGAIIRPPKHPGYLMSWVGAGSAPIPLGNNRFLADYHTGNYLVTGERDYFASFAVLDFNKFDPSNPEAIVESRCEGVLMPETHYELHSPWPHDKNLNCVFPCGSYEYNDEIVMIYGGADAYVLAARLSKAELLAQLDSIKGYCVTNAASLQEPARGRVPRQHVVSRELSHPVPVNAMESER